MLLWSVGFNMRFSISDSKLSSLLSHFDFLYLSFKGWLLTFWLLLSEIIFSFFQKRVTISSGRAVSDCELHCSFESLSDVATVTKEGVA